MKKIKIYILTIFVVILCMFCLSSCEENKNYQNYKPTQGSMFICVESYTDPYLGDVKILVDKQTRIMYIRYHDTYGDGQYSGMAVLYDSDGKPKKYSGVISE